MQRTVVINVVGLTPSLIGRHTPRLQQFAQQGAMARIEPMLPGVTCSVQSTYLTGKPPTDHGIVANGWYDRDQAEVNFWKQSNALVQGPKLWDTLRQTDPTFSCANFFWWYNMYPNIDVAVTPRPMYPADGRKLPDIHTHPAALRDHLQNDLGTFPLFNFWGPATSIKCSDWIADAAILSDKATPCTLSLIYLPHLDYNLQRLGPDDPAIAKDLSEIDTVCGKLIDHFTASGAHVVIVSEYGIQSVSRPVHLNRVLRENGFLAIRKEMDREYLDAGASAAFAVADHQVAHIYLKPDTDRAAVKPLLEAVPGVAKVLDHDEKREAGLDHSRSGELIALAEPDAWFTYYYWNDDAVAPDFARTVDIHRKPGYDPVELFLAEPAWRSKATILKRLIQKKFGMRVLMDVIPLDATRVRGSHGVAPGSPDEYPVLITQQKQLLERTTIAATDVHDVLARHVTRSA
ncbi:MAG: alkaline phosphatase family protein [Kiritimatiellae bacterium]|nr:alkaline phosphatase family protein [Kiritimatiellia bacterium]